MEEEKAATTAKTKKGTVTPLATVISPEEAQKAAKRVEEAMEEKGKEVEQIKQFIADNSNLISLVSRLPDQLHHDVMVPFGKAAFFPGRLIHTNELTVLLGEGYYAERTAKQTVEILKRRGKALESQVQALKANMEDLKAEASFFDATASEAVEGLVEIREDYVEDDSTKKQCESDGKKVTLDDDEYARIMSRLDELEEEELAAEDTNEKNENDESSAAETDSDNDGTYLDIREPEQQTISDFATAEALSDSYHHQLDFTDGSNCTGLTVESFPKDEIYKGKGLAENVERSLPAEKNFVLPEVKEKVEAVSLLKNEVPMQTTNSGFDSSKAFSGSIVESTHNTQRSSGEQTMTSSQKTSETYKTSNPGFDSSKAFTGSIVEHTHNLETTSKEQNATSSQPSKPVSRFKMQRR